MVFNPLDRPVASRLRFRCATRGWRAAPRCASATASRAPSSSSGDARASLDVALPARGITWFTFAP
jgi:hypothetical protein